MGAFGVRFRTEWSHRRTCEILRDSQVSRAKAGVSLYFGGLPPLAWQLPSAVPKPRIPETSVARLPASGR